MNWEAREVHLIKSQGKEIDKETYCGIVICN